MMVIILLSCEGNVVINEVGDLAIKDTASLYFDTDPNPEPTDEENLNEPSQPTSEPSQSNQPSGEPSQPTSEPSQSNQPSGEPSQPSSEPSQPTSEPSQSNQPSGEPSQPSSEPSQPTSEPSSTVDPCSNPTSVGYQLTLPNTYGCNWSQDGNLDATQGIYAAQEASTVTLNMDPGQVICDIQFPFDTDYSFSGLFASFGFDDHLVVTLNNRVLAASHEEIVGLLNSDSYGVVYDWDSIKGSSMSLGSFPPNWFIDSTSSISSVFPVDYPQASAFTLAFSHASLSGPLQKVYDDNEMEFSIITFGDNDGYDCYHTTLSFNFDVLIGE